MWQHLGWRPQKSFSMPGLWLWVIHEDGDPRGWAVPSKGLGGGDEDSAGEHDRENCTELQQALGLVGLVRMWGSGFRGCWDSLTQSLDGMSFSLSQHCAHGAPGM